MDQPKKTIELWDGYHVEFDESLLSDFEFASDLAEALNDNNIRQVVTMYMALVGGADTFEDVKEHVIEEYGYLSIDGIQKITQKIDKSFPKTGNRAQRRSWKTSV